MWKSMISWVVFLSMLPWICVPVAPALEDRNKEGLGGTDVRISLQWIAAPAKKGAGFAYGSTVESCYLGGNSIL